MSSPPERAKRARGFPYSTLNPISSTGTTTSMKAADTGPQLSAASRPRTKSVWRPSGQPAVESVPVTASIASSKAPSAADNAVGTAPGIHGGLSR